MLRSICVAACLLIAVMGCGHPQPKYDSTYTPPPAEPPTLAVGVIGDPHANGATTGTHAWPALVAATLKQQGLSVDLRIAARAAPADKDPWAAVVQVRDVVRPATKLVALFGSTSDAESSKAQLSSAVKDALTEAKKIAPRVKFLVIGPVWTSGQPPDALLKVRNVLTTEAHVAGATFIDPIAEGWFVDRPNLIGPDHTTLTDAGHAYLAGKIAPIIAQQLQSSPAGPVGAPR